jgi:hypothetical protein
MINQGAKLSESGFSMEGTYSSLDIPILLLYSLTDGPVQVGLLGGAHISIPLGDFEIEYSFMGMSESETIGTDGATFGLTAGLFGSMPAGPGSFVGDIRFIFDFNELTVSESGYSMDILSRRGLALTVGYKISF